MLDLAVGDEITIRLSPMDLVKGVRGDSYTCPWARCVTRSFGLTGDDFVRAGHAAIVMRSGASNVTLRPVTGDRERYARMITVIDHQKTGKLRVGLAEVTFVRES